MAKPLFVTSGSKIRVTLSHNQQVLEELYSSPCFNIAPQMKKEWQIIDFNNYEDKLLKLVSFGVDLESKIKVNLIQPKIYLQNEGKDQSSYFGNLGLKVLDNIQIDIKYFILNAHLLYRNIHIRFEDVYFGNQPYSFGITLKELSVQTCDENWAYKFFDRTLDENANKPIFKLLEMNKFAIYWQSNEESLASQE